ncbi:MAG: hypothetical protein ACTSV5_10245 [Promethearchaeota archaeon]
MENSKFITKMSDFTKFLSDIELKLKTQYLRIQRKFKKIKTDKLRNEMIRDIFIINPNGDVKSIKNVVNKYIKEMKL